MTTPKREAVLTRARELWVNDQHKHGCPELAETNPEDSELLENGYYSVAQSELMRDNARAKVAEWKGYSETVEREESLANTQQNHEKLENLVNDVVDYGDLLLIANKGVGKTNSLMVLAQRFRMLPDTRVLIFEDFPKFALEFDSVPYMVIRDNDVIETVHAVDLGGYWLKHEQDYAVKRGLEIQSFLDGNKDLIFTSEVRDIERQAFFIYSVVDYFYRRAYLRKFKGYAKTERIVFVIEESQNVFDSSIISRKIFNRLRKIFSVARNLDIHFILASQRMQDLNTKIRGRTKLLLGRVSLDDYELKIHRLLRHSRHRMDILQFERGQFLYETSDSVIQFPKFEPQGRPYEWNSETQEQPMEPEKSVWRQIRESLAKLRKPKIVIQLKNNYTEAELKPYNSVGD